MNKSKILLWIGLKRFLDILRWSLGWSMCSLYQVCKYYFMLKYVLDYLRYNITVQIMFLGCHCGRFSRSTAMLRYYEVKSYVKWKSNRQPYLFLVCFRVSTRSGKSNEGQGKSGKFRFFHWKSGKFLTSTCFMFQECKIQHYEICPVRNQAKYVF